MLPYCKQVETKPVDIFTGICLGTANALGIVGPYFRTDLRFCPPNSVTPKEYTSVLVKYLNAHPEQLDQTLITLTLKAFTAAWPCK